MLMTNFLFFPFLLGRPNPFGGGGGGGGIGGGLLSAIQVYYNRISRDDITVITSTMYIL